MSAIPEIDRKPFNPNAITNSFQQKLLIYKALNYTFMPIMITGFTGGVVGAVIGIVAYSTYSGFSSNTSYDSWEFYRNMQGSGFFSAIICGSIGLVAMIPFLVSYAIKPNSNKNKLKNDKISINFNYFDNNIYFGLNIKI